MGCLQWKIQNRRAGSWAAACPTCCSSHTGAGSFTCSGIWQKAQWNCFFFFFWWEQLICEECLNTEEISRTFPKVQATVGTCKDGVFGICMQDIRGQDLCSWMLSGGDTMKFSIGLCMFYVESLNIIFSRLGQNNKNMLTWALFPYLLFLCIVSNPARLK